MSSSFGRMRSTEAPMSGIEFTNRANTVPAWRRGADDHSTPVKRSHSTANPPPSPFDPKQGGDAKPLFGEGVRYLFRPQMPVPLPAPETPEVDMRDVGDTPPRAAELVREAGPGEDSPETRVISNAAVRRVERKRRMGTRAKSRLGRRRATVGEEGESGEDDDEDEDDADEGQALVTRKTSHHYTLNMPGPVAPTSDTPYILLGYLQFCFNLSLILVFLYLLLQFIFTVQRDVEQRIGEYSMEIGQEISTCAAQFKANLCGTNPIPAMMHQCAAWETCMARDPKVVGRAKVGAEMLAEVVNGFVEPISWKTLAFTLSSLGFMTVFVNALLSLYRSKLEPQRDESQHHMNRQANQLQLPPHFAMSPYGYMPPPTWRPESGLEQTPSRRRRLENGDAAGVQ